MARMTGRAIGLIVVNNIPDVVELYMVSGWHQSSPNGPGTKCTLGGPPDGKPPGCIPNPGLPVLAIKKSKGEELIELLQSSTVVIELKTGEIQPGNFKALHMLPLKCQSYGSTCCPKLPQHSFFATQVLQKIFNSTLFVSKLNTKLFPAGAFAANDAERGGWETALSETPSDPCLTHWYSISCNEGTC